MASSTAFALPHPDIVRDALEQIAQYGTLGRANAGLFDVGTDRFVSYVETELLDDLIVNSGSTCRFYEGGYGAGKTHLLHLLEELAVGRGMASARIELSQDLPLEDWRSLTMFLLQHLSISHEGQDVRGLPNILATLRESGRSQTKALRAASLPHAGFKKAMLHASQGVATSPALTSYLLGERVTVRQLQRDGFGDIKDPLTQRNAELVLETVTGGLFHLGVRGTMLLFDETERSFVSNRAFPSAKVRLAANLMRRLIDACTTGRLVGSIIVFAILPGFLENCAQIYEALGQRLEMARGIETAPSWRWPVLPVDALTATRGRVDFMQRVVTRLVQLVDHCGGNASGLEARLLAEGEGALAAHAGSGYRRVLMKRLATMAAEHIEGA
jgi:hypothetical protein